MQSFLAEETPWHVSFAFGFCQKYLTGKLLIGIALANIPSLLFDMIIPTLLSTFLVLSFGLYSFYLDIHARPRIIHRENRSWLERNKDQFVVYTFVAVISAALSNIDRIWEFFKALMAP